MGILVIILVMVSKYFWEVYKIFIVELDNDVCVNKVFVFFIFIFSLFFNFCSIILRFFMWYVFIIVRCLFFFRKCFILNI